MDPAIIRAVRDHAKANYERDGWDVLVECWEDSDIETAAGAAKTAKGAIANIRKTLKLHDSVRRDVQSEIF